MLVAGTTYTAIATFLLGIGVIPFSGSAIDAAQFILVPGIVASATKVCARNRGAMKENATLGIEGSWNHRRNGSAHIIDMIDTESGRVDDFEIDEGGNHRRQGNYRGSSNGMEAEAMRRMVGRWENDRKVKTVVTDEDMKLAKVMRESRWDLDDEMNANHAKKSFDRYQQRLPKEECQHLYLCGPDQRLRNWFNHVLHQPIPREHRIEAWESGKGHYCGDHTRCPDPAREGCQWRYRDDPDTRETLKGYLSEGQM
jgi:hypothetical protein